jgi:hypothetical protein
MSFSGQELEPPLSDTDRVIRDGRDLRLRMADCAQLLSDLHQEYVYLIGETMENRAAMKRLGIDRALVLGELAMPEALAGPPDAPHLTLVENC